MSDPDEFADVELEWDDFDPSQVNAGWLLRIGEYQGGGLWFRKRSRLLLYYFTLGRNMLTLRKSTRAVERYYGKRIRKQYIMEVRGCLEKKMTCDDTVDIVMGYTFGPPGFQEWKQNMKEVISEIAESCTIDPGGSISLWSRCGRCEMHVSAHTRHEDVYFVTSFPTVACREKRSYHTVQGFRVFFRR